MVINCNTEFDKNTDLGNYPFELSDFQKYALWGINEGNHVLVPAPTGSGKTLPAEYGIEKFVKLGKKVIYTSPIKSLSNQKFYEFSKKFPDISFGILTGDVKFNPEADVLIMTTEILRNNLFSKKENIGVNNFEMNMEEELACVIFDEIHYINDAERGKVWEECIMMLGKFNNVQMIMLSATIDRPEIFCDWIETNSSKSVVLTCSCKRVVPLKHHYYIAFPNGVAKNLKKEEQSVIFRYTNTVIDINNEQFDTTNYININNVINIFKMNNIRINIHYALNNIVKYLKKEELLPSICFVFNRKNVERFANMIEMCLFDETIKINRVSEECRSIISKLPNGKEYIELSEYNTIVKLLEKGIGIHHAGLLPVFREMIEIMFERGYVKLLFATETFAVGINLPTKSVIFSSLEKFDGKEMRYLYSHEYTQMAGRAGRRGLDKIGHVFHLNGVFELPMQSIYKNMIEGSAQRLESKFKIHAGLVLRIINEGGIDIENFCKNSNAFNEINSLLGGINNEIDNVYSDIDKKNISIYSHKELLDQYLDIEKKTKSHNKKTRKIGDLELTRFNTENKSFNKIITTYHEIIDLKNRKNGLESQKKYYDNYLKDNINKVVRYLEKFEFIMHRDDDIDNNNYEITEKGKLACNIQECHCLSLGEIIYDGYLDNLNEVELLGLLSCNNGLRLGEPYYNMGQLRLDFDSTNLSSVVNKLGELYTMYNNYEDDHLIDTSGDYHFNFDLIEFITKWYYVDNEIDAKELIYDYHAETGVFIGELIKSILKTVNVIGELVKIYEGNDDNLDVLSKLNNCKERIMKFIVNTQSLYLSF
jgi:superfamily II RNA helicase